MPSRENLEEKEVEIIELSDLLWDEMEYRFLGGSRETIEQAGALKSITDKADKLLGPMYNLSEEEIEYIKDYDEQYRLYDVNQIQLVDVDFELKD